MIEPFAGYAFNKAHAFCYALIAYQTAYLKANYPAEYITALLMVNADQSEKVTSAVAECRRLNIAVLPPDINRSQVNFAIEKDDGQNPAIRFGLAAIKNVGPGAIEPLVAERSQGGDFKSVEDLCRRSDLHGVNKRVLESLIKAGAFDSLGDRGTLLNSVNVILSLAQREQRLRETGQTTMFDLWGEETSLPMPSLEMAAADVSVREKLAWEKELMGVYLSQNPLSSFTGKVIPGNTVLCGHITEEMVGKSVMVAGMVTEVSELFTKDRRPFARVALEDLDGRIEVMAWSKVYEDTRELWQDGNTLLVTGKVRVRNDSLQLHCDRVDYLQTEVNPEEDDVFPPVVEARPPDASPAGNRRLVINVRQTDDEDSDIARLRRLIDAVKAYPGKDEVNLSVSNQERVTNLHWPEITTNYCPELHQRLAEIVGEDGLRVEQIEVT